MSWGGLGWGSFNRLLVLWQCPKLHMRQIKMFIIIIMILKHVTPQSYNYRTVKKVFEADLWCGKQPPSSACEILRFVLKWCLNTFSDSHCVSLLWICIHKLRNSSFSNSEELYLQAPVLSATNTIGASTGVTSTAALVLTPVLLAPVFLVLILWVKKLVRANFDAFCNFA